MRKEGEHKQQAPPELLEEVFELNESLDELREAKRQPAAISSALRADSSKPPRRISTKSFAKSTPSSQIAAQQWDAALDANAGDDASRKQSCSA